MHFANTLQGSMAGTIQCSMAGAIQCSMAGTIQRGTIQCSGKGIELFPVGFWYGGFCGFYLVSELTSQVPWVSTLHLSSGENSLPVYVVTG